MNRTAVLLILLAIWTGLMILGIISALDPPWLQKLAHRGITMETRLMKDYADSALRRGDVQGAIRQYKQALEFRPDYFEAMANLAVAYLQDGQEALALGQLEQLKASAPDQAQVLGFSLGEIYQRQGKRERARELFQQSLDTEIPSYRVYRKLGSLHLEAGRLIDARRSFESALESQASLADQYRYMLHRSVRAYQEDPPYLPAIEAALQQDPESWGLERYDPEIPRRMLRWDQANAHLHDRLGFIRVRQGDLAAGAEHFRTSLKIRPDNPETRQNLDRIEQALRTGP